MTQSSLSYVRGEMLGQQTPPSNQTGAEKWVRENLFSGPLNTILTVVSLYVLYWVVTAAFPWFWHSTWAPASMEECRAAIEKKFGAGETGACWGVIRQRWHQFIFGFYPQDIFWRPVLAFGLMLCALAPVLYFGLRRINMWIIGSVGLLTLLAAFGVAYKANLAEGMKPSVGLTGHDSIVYVIIAAAMLALFVLSAIKPKLLIYFSMLYPFVGFYLLWGGSIWGPLGVFVGFIIFALVLKALQNRVGVPVAGGVALVVAMIWWLKLQTGVTTQLHGMMPIGLFDVNSDKFGGFLLAFVLGVTAVAASLPMGLLLALGRRSDMPFIKGVSVAFIEFIRGVPLITMLFTASLLLNYFLPPKSNFDLILRVVILVIFFAAAYIAEVIRGGLAALPKGQLEAADALGLDYWQAQRLIILPQALKISIPGIVSSFIGLFKDTTLVAIIGLAEPLQGVTKIVRAEFEWKSAYWEPLIFVGAIFFLFCFAMSRYSMYLERKLKTDHR